LAHTPTSISYTGADGERVTVETESPSAALKELIVTLGDLDELTVAPPTLEATYLRLVAS
jgi:hypothetical protein